MSSIVMSEKMAFADELIRENARLTVQHEADLLVIDTMQERIQSLGQSEKEIVEMAAEYNKLKDETCLMKADLDITKAKLTKAILDLSFVMAGGDPCQVCAKTCMMGEGNCEPVWRTGEAGQ